MGRENKMKCRQEILSGELQQFIRNKHKISWKKSQTVQNRRYMVSTGSSCHKAIEVVFHTLEAVLSGLSTLFLFHDGPKEAFIYFIPLWTRDKKLSKYIGSYQATVKKKINKNNNDNNNNNNKW